MTDHHTNQKCILSLSSLPVPWASEQQTAHSLPRTPRHLIRPGIDPGIFSMMTVLTACLRSFRQIDNQVTFYVCLRCSRFASEFYEYKQILENRNNTKIYKNISLFFSSVGVVGSSFSRIDYISGSIGVYYNLIRILSGWLTRPYLSRWL